MKKKILAKKFLDKYPDHPEHMTNLGMFVFYRTYSRMLEDGRYETWKEAIHRAVEYSIQISLTQYKNNDIPAPFDKVRMEGEKLFDNIFNLRQALSGRTHWIGGAKTGVADKFPLANFNCAFTNINSFKDIEEVFYLLLVGTGVGVKCTKEMADNLPRIRDDVEVLHSVYEPLPKEERLERTQVTALDNGYAKIYIGDSKEGWVQALTQYFELLTDADFDYVKHIKFSYNSIRPKGEVLKTFGGRASGHEPIMEMFDKINMVIKGTLDTSLEIPERLTRTHVQLRPIHILDICGLLGNNVVVGGVRRTALMFLMSPDDWEVILAKYGLFGIHDVKRHHELYEKLTAIGADTSMLDNQSASNGKAKPHLYHRMMSNNSIAFEKKPTEEYLDVIFDIMQNEGEPAFVNLESAKRRRPNAEGVNPCGEILLDSKQVCNLTTINIKAFVLEEDGQYRLDFPGLMEAQALSVRAGMRMTMLDLELNDWNKNHHRDRMVGASMTGFQDAMDLLDYNEDQIRNLLNLLSDSAHTEGMRYAHIMRIPMPLLTTTVKPEGTLSKVFGGVSEGIHRSYAPYFIQRIRINATDPLVRVGEKLGWHIDPEVGQENLPADKVTTKVISFYIKSGAKRPALTVSAKEQLETYFTFQKEYTQHNSSNTIYVQPEEWTEMKEMIYDQWDDFIGVTFLEGGNGKYALAPKEEITEEEYYEFTKNYRPFDYKLFKSLTSTKDEKDMAGLESCSTGGCPII